MNDLEKGISHFYSETELDQLKFWHMRLGYLNSVRLNVAKFFISIITILIAAISILMKDAKNIEDFQKLPLGFITFFLIGIGLFMFFFETHCRARAFHVSRMIRLIGNGPKLIESLSGTSIMKRIDEDYWIGALIIFSNSLIIGGYMMFRFGNAILGFIAGAVIFISQLIYYRSLIFYHADDQDIDPWPV